MTIQEFNETLQFVIETSKDIKPICRNSFKFIYFDSYGHCTEIKDFLSPMSFSYLLVIAERGLSNKDFSPIELIHIGTFNNKYEPVSLNFTNFKCYIKSFIFEKDKFTVLCDNKEISSKEPKYLEITIEEEPIFSKYYIKWKEITDLFENINNKFIEKRKEYLDSK